MPPAKTSWIQKKLLEQEGSKSSQEARRREGIADDPEIRLFSRRGDHIHIELEEKDAISIH